MYIYIYMCVCAHTYCMYTSTFQVPLIEFWIPCFISALY